MRVVLTGALEFALWRGRRELLEDWRARGWEIHVILPEAEAGPEKDRIPWVTLHRVPLHRASMNPARDIRTIRAYRERFRAIRPEAVLAYNPKPVLYSGIALERSPEVRFVALVTGRGALERRAGVRGGISRRAVRALYRRSLERADAILFQNEDDRSFFTSDVGGFDPARVGVIPGSGVNLERYAVQPLPSGPIRFLAIARLLEDKGVREFVEAAHRMAEAGADVRFRVVGGWNEAHPAAVPKAELEQWKERGVVEFTGHADDVRPQLAWCSVLCHASYAEGTPRAVLEAMSTGRGIITTDAPGCRHTIVPGESGILVPPRDAGALEQAMRWFVDHAERLPAFSRAARRRAEDVFDVRGVVAQVGEAMMG
jgi:glycosyltransferase involved in cell wall biosynthesis